MMQDIKNRCSKLAFFPTVRILEPPTDEGFKERAQVLVAGKLVAFTTG